VLPSVSAVLKCSNAPGAFAFAEDTFDFAGNTNFVPGCYRIVVALNWVVAQNQASACRDGLQSSITPLGGFIGSEATTPDTAALRILELLKWLIQFQEYQTIEYIAAGARFQYFNPPNATTSLDPLSLVFSTSNFAALFNVEKFALSSADFAVLHAFRASGLTQLTCGSTNVVLAQSGEQLNLIPSGVIFGFGYIICFSSLALCLFLFVWVHVHKSRAVVRLSSPVFMWTILFGGVISLLTIIPLSMQDDSFDRNLGYTAAELDPLDFGCMAIPWLFTMGFCLQFSALFIKTWRLIVIFHNPHMKRFKHLHDKDLMVRMLPLFVVVIFVNALWMGVDPLVWDRVPLTLSAQGGYTVVSSVGYVLFVAVWGFLTNTQTHE